MEAVRQNQPEIPPKRIKFEEMMEEEVEEVDRISALPDCLLLEILSRLPTTKHAIKTGTLSKRWEHLWTSIPILIFSELYDCYPEWFDLVLVVDKTLTQCRHLKKLKKFLVDTEYKGIRNSQVNKQVNDWIRYAMSRDVEELSIRCWGMDFVPDQFVFTSSCFTDGSLSDCMIDPAGPISWNKLRSLSISYATFDEDVIENILSGSPLLETLKLVECYGYRRLNITSKSVKNLVFSVYWSYADAPSDSHIIEINAPNILSLTIRDTLKLGNLLLVNVSSLVEANLDYVYERAWFVETSHKKAEEEMLKGLIQSLSHVKELKIGVSCSHALARLEARGFVFSSNLRIPASFKRVEYGDLSDSDEE